MDGWQVIAITLGVCIFNFGGGKKKVGKKDSPWGLMLIAVSLFMDAFTGGLQVQQGEHSSSTRHERQHHSKPN